MKIVRFRNGKYGAYRWLIWPFIKIFVWHDGDWTVRTKNNTGQEFNDIDDIHDAINNAKVDLGKRVRP